MDSALKFFPRIEFGAAAGGGEASCRGVELEAEVVAELEAFDDGSRDPDLKTGLGVDGSVEGIERPAIEFETQPFGFVGNLGEVGLQGGGGFGTVDARDPEGDAFDTGGVQAPCGPVIVEAE